MKLHNQQMVVKEKNYHPYLWLFIGLALFLVANGRWIIPAATWLFPVFIIRFLRTKRGLLNSVLCVLGYIGVMTIAWQGMVQASGVLYFLIISGIGLLMFLPFLADKILVPRLRDFGATLAFPLAYTTVEYLVSLLNPFGTWTFLGYTQFSNYPLMQIVSVTGIFGITFLVTWFGSVVNWVWDAGGEWTKIQRGIKLYAVVVMTVLLFGGVYLTLFSPKSDTVKVAGVQSELLESVIDPAEVEKLMSESLDVQFDYLIERHKLVIDDLFVKSEMAAQSGARIVSWAEATFNVYREDEQALIERGEQLAQQEHIYLVMAYDAVLHTDEALLPEVKLYENKVVVIGPDGEVLSTYVKTNLVPGDEATYSVKGGNDFPVVDTPYGRLSTTICFENDFPAFTRKIGLAGVDILINPSNDWVEIDPYHTQMQAFRAIENGYSTVRITHAGLSAAYDYHGRTLAAMDYFDTSDKVFSAYLPEQGITTVYAAIGDVFSWLCVIGFIAVSGIAFLRKREI